MTRHVMFEVLKTLVAALLVLTGVLTLAMAGKEAVRTGIPAHVVLSTLPFFLVQMLGYSLPAATLYAACSVFGRLSANNEILAVKSVGIRAGRIAAPILAVAYLISLLTVVTYDVTACWSRPGVRRLLAESVAEVARGVLQTQRAINLPWCSIAVREVEGDALVGPCVRMRQKNGQRDTVIVARRGALESCGSVVKLVMHDAEAQVGGDTFVEYPGRFEFDFPLEQPDRPVHRDWLALSELRPRAEEMRNRRLAVQHRMAAAAAAGQETADAEHQLRDLEWKIARLQAEPHRRWANAFSCIAFTLIGIPVATFLRNSDAPSTFFAAFLPVVIVYYPLLMASEQLAVDKHVPSVFWLGDLVLAAIGGLLWVRAFRR